MFKSTDTSSMNLDEIVATGQLYKQGTTHKNWQLRKFILSGIYLIYFDKSGEKKGQWDITGCMVKKVSPEECNMPSAAYAFALTAPKRYHLMCASSEKNRHAWMTVIDEQIDSYKENIRRFLRTGETILGNAIVKKKAMFGSSNVRLLLTNFPRIQIIDPSTLVLKEQLSWVRDEPPSFTRLSDTKFKVNYGSKEMAFEDVENGTKYWEDIFRRFPNMKYYVFKVQKSLNIDYHSFVDPKDAVEYEDNGPPGQKMQKSAADLAREERDRQNMMFLQGALRNIEELVAALSQRIMELDTEEQEAAASGKDTDALRADRANKKQQLQILMDNVAVLSANMQALYSKSLEMGTTDFDLEAIENVMRETSAMLAMLQDGDDYDPELEGEVGGAEQGALELSDEVEWLALDDSLTSELFAQLDMIQDILITPENFLATDISRRPKDWNEVRMKRVLMREYVDRLEGVDEITIKERRAQRIAAEERSMVKEVAERGRLLNMPVLRKVSTKSQRLAALAAALAITDDNFDPDSIDRRPLAWQAVKLRRAITKEDIYRRNGMDEKSIADQRKALLEEEEKRMLGEVKKYGMVLSIGAPRATDTPYKASKLKISPETYDPQDHNKRPEGWFELRHQRVLVREHADRLAGVSEDSIFESRLQKEREEEDAMMEEVASGGRVISVRYDLNTEVRTTGAKADAVMKFTPSNFDPSDPNKRPKGWFELRTKRVLIREQADRDAGISEEAIAELRSRRELEEEALMITEVMSSGAVLGAGVQSNQQKIVITKNNFVANDSTFRPPGWAELRLRRVMFKESIDRIAGIDEENIADMRSDREIKEEALMVDEVLCLGRVLGVGESSGTLIPKVSVVVISSATFDPSIPSKRPTGWVEARTKRVMMKEQIDRTKGVSEELILGNRAFKTDREEQLMLEEVATYGHLVGVGGLLEEGELPLQVPVLIFNKDNFDPMYPSKRPDGWVAARKKRVYKKERIEALRGMTSGAIEESHRQREIDEEHIMLEEVEKYGHLIGIGGPVKSLVIKNVNDSLDIDDSNFDLATGKRPKGWNEVKMRRVYLKEWLDRKNGVDEETIIARRPEREREVEAEMINEASVFNRVRAIEKRIKNNKNTGGLFPKGYVSVLKKDKKPVPATTNGKARPVSMAIGLHTLKAANSAMETLSEQVCDTLTEKSLGDVSEEVTTIEPKSAPSGNPPSMRIMSKRFESTPVASSAPPTQSAVTASLSPDLDFSDI